MKILNQEEFEAQYVIEPYTGTLYKIKESNEESVDDIYDAIINPYDLEEAEEFDLFSK